jgi:hypothetical protein
VEGKEAGKRDRGQDKESEKDDLKRGRDKPQSWVEGRQKMATKQPLSCHLCLLV